MPLPHLLIVGGVRGPPERVYRKVEPRELAVLR